MTAQPACDLNALAIGAPRGICIAGVDICLVRTPEKVFAVRDECTHAAVPLSDGDVDVDACTIECWMHGSRFDLSTGVALNLPATKAVRTFQVRVIDGMVLVDLP